MASAQNSQESERLTSLREYDILDTFSEKDYDNITLMASIICDAPVSLITFIDDKRQWFKSHLGTEVNETPREYAFCTHALDKPGEAFVIEDSRTDNRFMDNPFVTGDPHVVFYAGVPFTSDKGYALGTVCVLDTKPRTLTPQQITALQALAGQVANLLALRKKNIELSEAKNLLERKNAALDENAHKLTMALDKHVSDRIDEVATQNKMLEKMNSELQSFTFISSHDLQEPLRKIQMFASTLMEYESQGLSDKGVIYLEKIGKSATRMRYLINDLLSYTRTTESEKVFTSVMLSQIVEEVSTDLEDRIAEADAVIEVSNDIKMKVITFQFRQLLYNLVSNALKFRKPGRGPLIRIDGRFIAAEDMREEMPNSGEPCYRISVSDNGMGFSNEFNQKIFQLFHRLDTSISNGTGIGLAIVKKIVDNHKGIIGAQGKPGEGTVFTIYIPCQS